MQSSIYLSYNQKIVNHGTLGTKNSNRIGRNDKCPCGSGRKYKKCHLSQHESLPSLIIPDAFNKELPREAITHLNYQRLKHEAEKEMLAKYGFHLSHIEQEFQGKRYRAVFSRLVARPMNETFHEFIVDLLKQQTGVEWGNEQLQLPREKRHFIIFCYEEFMKWLKTGLKTDPDGRFSGRTNGYAQWFISLAFDVYCLSHVNRLPDVLINRLKNWNEFQGALYEIKIAAIFARLGCEIEFLPKDKVCRAEFLAIHKQSGSEFLVEAKSRQKDGVYHRPGEYDDYRANKGDVHHLLNSAMNKETDEKPFLIFIDVNAPLSPPKTPTDDIQWIKDVKKFTYKFAGTPEKPAKQNFIVYTNFSSHLLKRDASQTTEYVICKESYPRSPLPNDDLLENLEPGLKNYGSVPDLK